MKKRFLFIWALVAALWMSCSSDVEFPPQSHIALADQVSSEYLVEEGATSITIDFSARQDWFASVSGADASWLSVSPESGAKGENCRITIQVSANPEFERRSGTVILRSQERAVSRRFSVSQFGAKSEGSIRLLAIGNSFSDDALEYLYQILEQAGYSSIKLGNLYIGGCSLEKHADNFATGAAVYDYRVNTNGTWKTTPSYSSVEALKEENWDYVSLQQVSGFSGVADSYEPFLGRLIAGVKSIRPNAKLLWHMTWAYQHNSGHSDFAKYDRNQETMYKAIVAAVQANILPGRQFSAVVPSGTAIQNLRTSFVGDNLTRDGYHLSFDLGRYTAALTWAKALTGCDLAAIDWTPAEYLYSPRQLEAIKEAVENAAGVPYEVTPSTYTEDDKPLSDLQKLIQAAGYEVDDYVRLNFDLIHPGYYNSASDIPMTVQTNLKNYATTRIFRKSEFPDGTLIVQKEGYQYRPEGWVAENQRNSGRPDNVSARIIEVNAAWWGSYNFRAFNIQKTGVGDLTNILDEVKESFGIFVPKSAISNPGLEELLKAAGYDPAAYQLLYYDLIYPGYYNSASDIPMTVQTNLKNFATTRIFAKSEFPDGTLIVQKEGYQYRPEGWVAENQRNSSRPDNVSARMIEVNAAWWGSYNFRAFNIQKTGVGDLGPIQTEVKDAFGIYVPKK